MGDERSLILQFAQAIGADGRAQLIDRENRTNGRWISVEQSVASRQAFFVTARADIVPLEADSAQDAGLLSGLAEHLVQEGWTPVLDASGRPGHVHLNVRITDDDYRNNFLDLLKRCGKGRLIHQAIRPLLSPT
jgi:hypothetical protein